MIHQKFHQNFKIISECILTIIGISIEVLPFGNSSKMVLCNSSDCGSKPVLALKKPTFLGESAKIGLLYRSPNLLPNLFLESLTSRIDEEKQIFCSAISTLMLYFTIHIPQYNRDWKITSYWFLNLTIWTEAYLIMFTLQGHSLLTKYQLQW